MQSGRAPTRDEAAPRARIARDAARWMRANWTILAVVAGGLAVRVGWMLVAAPEPVSDFAMYRVMGERFLETGGLVDADGIPGAYYFPGTPILLAMLMLVSDAVWWLSLGMILLSTAAVVLVWMLAKRLGLSDPVALVAAAVVAFLPHLVAFAPVLATEHPFTALMLGSLVVALGGTGAGTWRWVAVGVLAGSAALTRGDGLFYLPVILGATIWAHPGPTSRRILRMTISGLVVLVLIGGWYVRNVTRVDPSAGLSTVGGVNFYYAHNPHGYGWSEDNELTGLGIVEANRLGYELAWDYIGEHPESILTSMYEGTRSLYGSSEYAWEWSTSEPESDTSIRARRKPVPLSQSVRTLVGAGSVVHLVLAAVSVLTIRSWPARALWVLPSLVGANWVGFTVISHAKPRFRYFVDVLLAIAVAIVIWRLVRKPADHDAPDAG